MFLRYAALLVRADHLLASLETSIRDEMEFAGIMAEQAKVDVVRDKNEPLDFTKEVRGRHNHVLSFAGLR